MVSLDQHEAYFSQSAIFPQYNYIYENLQASSDENSVEPDVVFDPGSVGGVVQVGEVGQPANEGNCGQNKTSQAKGLFQVFFEVHQAEGKYIIFT